MQHLRPAEKVRKIFSGGLFKRQSILASFDPPCGEVDILPAIKQREGSVFGPFLRVWYHKTTYQEIVNNRNIGVETCWSGIGGFIGIFIGYSLMQVPDVISSVFGWMMQHLQVRL